MLTVGVKSDDDVRTSNCLNPVENCQMSAVTVFVTNHTGVQSLLPSSTTIASSANCIAALITSDTLLSSLNAGITAATELFLDNEETISSISELLDFAPAERINS